MNGYGKRIKRLEKQYSSTHKNTGERLSKKSSAKIDKAKKDNQKRRRVDSVLTNVRSKDTVKEEVHEIIQKTDLNQLCSRCSFEEITAVVILYVWQCRNRKLKLEDTRLWKRYGLSWKRYGLILSRLLQITRAKRPVQRREVDLLFMDYLDKKS